ncbi:malate synthase G [Colwellia sp. RE-S-Sl-9]
MSTRKNIDNLQIDEKFYNFIAHEVLPGIDVNNDTFWRDFSKLITDLSPINKNLLAIRESMQEKIDQWHQENSGELFNFKQYKQFLKAINYIATEAPNFNISTSNVDDELAILAGPQLVVPVMNARFALNAVNARWGSLYDALYGSDIISDENGAEKATQYNPLRGNKVIAFGRDFLDKTIPLANASHSDVVKYEVIDNSLVAKLSNNETTQLQTPQLFKGYTGEIQSPKALLFVQNGLHFEINFNSASEIAKTDKAGISDITLESALTTIMDCEDSVAAVDVEDKITTYKNWLGLNKGNLEESIIKNGKSIKRVMAKDRIYQGLSDNEIILKGRSLMFVRNVGHLMTTPAILDQHNNEVPEGIVDAVITSLIAMHNIKNSQTIKNSRKKSIYIVKPKMHGPEEVAFTNTLFERVEHMLSLPKLTIKMGIMDEERRTSINLKSCIYAAKERVVFINTGFLDRTGDEIHTSMCAGPFARKAEIKNKVWIGAYENNNVDIGLACGFSGKAQIGKGMWAIPDQMKNMLTSKIDHPKSGASTAWVPSPTAATLHALHYHEVNVFDVQKKLLKRIPASVDDILTIPLADEINWSEEEIINEIDNNVQGILGYVVRWIDQGIGCSKVPDINNVALMEDRATLRISSQHIANWIKHNVCTKEQVMQSFTKMAKIVDEQNKNDPLYVPIADHLDNSLAFEAATQLVFLGESQPSGYTEPLLHHYRTLKKQAH